MANADEALLRTFSSKSPPSGLQPAPPAPLTACQATGLPTGAPGAVQGPLGAATHPNLGDAHLHLGRKDDARGAYQQAVLRAVGKSLRLACAVQPRHHPSLKRSPHLPPPILQLRARHRAQANLPRRTDVGSGSLYLGQAGMVEGGKAGRQCGLPPLNARARFSRRLPTALQSAPNASRAVVDQESNVATTTLDICPS